MSHTPDNIRNMWEEAAKKRNLQVVKPPQVVPPQPPAAGAKPKAIRYPRGHEENTHWWNPDGSPTQAYFDKDKKKKFNTDY